MADDRMVNAARIAVALPWRESFGRRKSGAVALCVRDFALYSRFRDEIDILGAGVCEYEDVRYRRLTGWRRWWRRDRSAYAEAVTEAARDYGLIEVQNRPYLIAPLRRRFPRAKLALHLHNDPQTMDGSRAPRERARLLASCDAIYCVSGFIRGRLLEGVEDREGRSVVILNAAPAPGPAVRKERIVAFTGRIAAIKGAVELARAFSAADLPDWRLVVAGGDPDRLLRPSERVELLGQVSHAEAQALLARADIAVVPSMWDDPCPRAAIEALAHGCALVTTRRGGLPEIAEGAALFVDPADVGSFASALRRLALDDGLRRDLQARGRARAAQSFEIGAATGRLDGVRARLLGCS